MRLELFCVYAGAFAHPHVVTWENTSWHRASSSQRSQAYFHGVCESTSLGLKVPQVFHCITCHSSRTVRWNGFKGDTTYSAYYKWQPSALLGNLTPVERQCTEPAMMFSPLLGTRGKAAPPWATHSSRPPVSLWTWMFSGDQGGKARGYTACGKWSIIRIFRSSVSLKYEPCIWWFVSWSLGGIHYFNMY